MTFPHLSRKFSIAFLRKWEKEFAPPWVLSDKSRSTIGKFSEATSVFIDPQNLPVDITNCLLLRLLRQISIEGKTIWITCVSFWSTIYDNKTRLYMSETQVLLKLIHLLEKIDETYG